MDESEVLLELSRKTGLSESATDTVLRSLRELVRDGDVNPTMLLAPPAKAALPDPEDTRLVDDLIARARRHPLGLEFLLGGLLASVAMVFGVHAFTVDAARKRLLNETREETNAS